MSKFEVTVLGASGGPDVGETQCFLIRPFGWHGLESVCVDGGAGTTQISRMLAGELRVGLIESFYERDYEPVNQFFDSDVQVRPGLSDSTLHALDSSPRITSYRSAKVYESIKGYYVTHPHLDHIAAMVVDSPLIFNSPKPMAKTIWGLPFTTSAIERFIFNDSIWPNLIHGGGQRLKTESLTDQIATTNPTFTHIEITPFRVSHGKGAYSPREKIFSTVYLFRDITTDHCIIICGDMEPDSDEPLLSNLCSYLAARVPLHKIKAIIVECSSPIDTKELYGHMSPTRLVEELSHLQNVYGCEQRPDMDVIITHVKGHCSFKDPRLVILNEVRQEAQRFGLEGIRFSVAVKGYTFYL
ncbi:hypothetical protein ZYGR_0P04000 [Zygosaccharomyces rouxii]|uniref:ZYRO0E09702p n=2 Tax=Zygosaccharomyces rouxii TaxID=4956 RepID=C5E4Y3_ZYGRC|nr:uncharacterized protein ZYRO0E09702g [Zygosaccharomyces rouxii]KAH9198051.1 cyclic-AMP phosphodiesterase [Zygosaccharomyces rouxii]GAV49754.1 hypothetical protein ZYGR_0P04000 [Zygosaccharomyces rouxii]CAR31094.1 ZYRO0E09702p [Zygosaccharomyces rouxii]